MSFKDRFMRNLGAIHVDEELMRNIYWHYSSQLMVLCDSPDDALHLYLLAKKMPTAQLTKKIAQDTGLSLGSFLKTEKPHIVAASDEKGQQLIIKLLRHIPDPTQATFANEMRRAAEEREAGVIADLQLEVPTVPLVPTKIAAIEDPSAENRTFNAFIMPRFVTTVAQAPSFSHPALVHGGRRMMVALEYMHARSIAHLDIKTDNVFVNQAGEWWLGDFGSARSFASDSTDTVYSTTEPYYPTSILGRKPSPRFDWYMLCVMLCICAADAREGWTDQFGSPVRDSSIRAYVKTLEGTELGAVLAELLDKHDLLE